jgi:predicted CXXCH cytochrome family protein
MNVAARQLRALLLLLSLAAAVVLVGCDRGKSDPATQPAQTSGASPEHYLTTGPAAPQKPRIRVPPATKPAITLAANATCMTAECHASFADAPQVHGPISKGACNACHEDDVGGHKFPLRRKGNDTCTFCHTVLGSASHVHKAVLTGCTSCHQPHASNAKFLLKADTIERTCAACHDVPLKKHAHEPFAKGECTLCHLPHEADNVTLLRGGEGSKHCFTCHEGMKQTLEAASHVHQPAKQDCGLCHNPHATDFDHQLTKPIDQTCYTCHQKIKDHVASSSVAHGAMVSEKSCGNCHDAHASNNASLLRHRTDEVCLTCHDKPVSTAEGRTIAGMKVALTQSKFLHGPNRAGNCSACHDPHGATNANLLERAFPDSFYARFDVKKYDLCFSCHDKQLVLTAKTTGLTNFRDGETNLHFVHVNREDKGRSCRTCHDVHGSDLPKHMASEVPFEGSSWSMPIQYEQTSDGGRCAPGCHTPREYHRLATTLPTTAATTMATTTRGVP